MPLLIDVYYAYFRATLSFGEPPDNLPSFTAFSNTYFHTRIDGCGHDGNDPVIVPQFFDYKTKGEYAIWLKNARSFKICLFDALGFMGLGFVWGSDSLKVTCFLKKNSQTWHPRLSFHIKDRNNSVEVTIYDESPISFSDTFPEIMTKTLVMSKGADELLLFSLTPDTGFRSWKLSVAQQPMYRETSFAPH